MASQQVIPIRDRQTNTLLVGLRLLRLGPVLVLAVIVIAVGIAEPLFFSARNIANVAVQSSLIAVLAMGALLVIVTRGIDLSVGSTLALSGVMGAVVFRDLGSPWLTVLAILATGTLVGLVNALVYVKGRVPHPFIVTLASLTAVRGLALLVADGTPISGMPEIVQWAGSGRIGPLPVPVLIVAVLAVLLHLFSTRVVWGRWIYALGGNPDAAREVGIPTQRVTMSVYIISGLCAGIAGLLTAGRTDAGAPAAGNLAELDAIAAVIIGGASFFGGRGTIFNAVVGSLIIGVVRNGMNLLGVDVYVQLVVVGVIIVLAVQLDVLRQRFEGKFRALEAAK